MYGNEDSWKNYELIWHLHSWLFIPENKDKLGKKNLFYNINTSYINDLKLYVERVINLPWSLVDSLFNEKTHYYAAYAKTNEQYSMKLTKNKYKKNNHSPVLRKQYVLNVNGWLGYY